MEIKTIQSSAHSYSTRLTIIFVGVVLIALIVLIVATQKMARKGYVHVGQEETMVV